MSQVRTVDFEEGDIVASKVNPYYQGTYTIMKCLKTVCWTRTNDADRIVHKNIPYDALRLVRRGNDAAPAETAPDGEEPGVEIGFHP